MIKRHALRVQPWVPDYILEWGQGNFSSENSWFDDEYSVIAKNLCTLNISMIEKSWKQIVSHNHEGEEAKKYYAIVFLKT